MNSKTNISIVLSERRKISTDGKGTMTRLNTNMDLFNGCQLLHHYLADIKFQYE